MKRILFALAVNSALLGMQEVEVGLPIEMMDLRVRKPHQCCQDLFGKVESSVRTFESRAEVAKWLLRAANAESDTFTQFLCSKEQTADLDDVEEAVFIEKDLLKRMLVYVYQAHNSSQLDALDILAKISKKDFELNQIAITKKDWYHRLLVHIPWTGQRDHNSCYPLLIKNKVIFLKIDFNSCIHIQKEIKPCHEHARIATPLTDADQISQEFNKMISLTKIG